MMNTSRAVVNRIISREEGLTRFHADLNGSSVPCINYDYLTGEVREGDHLIVNTTAMDLKLGSGGFHFVVANLFNPGQPKGAEGHIMKLRYTPMQMNCLCSEAPESPFHEIFNRFESLNGMKVVIGTLHSMLAPVVLCIHALFPYAKIAYIMTDGGALPMWLSNNVRKLKKDKLICSAITYGNAFGGDLECINIYTALIAAKEIAGADIAVITMGPGIAGTATPYGFSGAEQGYLIDAVNQLGGFPIAIPRLSFSDVRDRHRGISHQSLTVLGRLCSTKANVAIPVLDCNENEYILYQIRQHGLDLKHLITYRETAEVDSVLSNKTAYLDKMGRGYEADRAYFLACGVSALLYDS